MEINEMNGICKGYHGRIQETLNKYHFSLEEKSE